MTELPPEHDVNGWDWLGVALLIGCGLLSGLLETLLVPLYLGSTVFPVAIVMALVGNVVLPYLAHALVPRAMAAVAPILAWLIAVVGFGGTGRPEGDVILPGSPSSLQFVTYGVIIGGFAAGAAAVIWLTTPRARDRDGQPVKG